ncbi:ribosome biogenesis regulatory protein [Thraustotheca clavata]|uniref:Ribosome biogenesis regulatory protein n=1 Tax=Thraustotheca clavata TaxID=74557 RepID=A0A1V9ZCQ0_9STRA|nr:ribosome biogenesis regulatory protein [Thraustotheca clavata]
MAIKAAEIAPAAYSEGKNSSIVSKQDDLTYDLGNLAAFDTHPFIVKNLTNENEIKASARDNVQLLINAIFDLPREMTDVGPMSKLPVGTTLIPREKPLPKPKVETRWEKFAREKGIENKKKERMVWDEEKQAWAPRWGYKRANDDIHDWAIPVKKNDDPYADPWTERKQAKAERVQKNMRNQANNLKNGRGITPSVPVPKAPVGIPVELLDTQDKKTKQRGKEGTKAALQKVQFSTASMGKFDKMRQGEAERKQKGKRNKFLSVTGSEQTEKERSMSVLNHVLGREENKGKGKPSSNTDEDPKKSKKRKLKNITKGHAKRAKK